MANKNKKSVIARFMKKVRISNSGCWQWTGSCFPRGYGAFWFDGALCGAHRFIYQYVHDKKLPKDIYVCHTCDNTSCVNLSHLFEGTAADNMADRNNKNRQAKGESNGNHKLTEEDVIEIKSSRIRADVLARKFGVIPNVIYSIKKGTAWRHVK